MSKKNISTNTAPKAIGPYSQAILADKWLFVSGQIPIDPANNELVTGDISAQTERVLKNLQAVVESAGGKMESVVKTTIYLKDLKEFGVVNEIYARYFTSNYPARATVEVSRLPKDVKVEIDAVAFLG